jgi:hypothetical protein
VEVPARPRRGFFFWTLSPFLLIFVVLMPLLVQKRDPPAVLVLIGVETTAILMLLGLFDPHRFWWAWRGVGGAVFLAYAVYIVLMVMEGRWHVPHERNLVYAILGLIAFGIPGLWWALFGRFPTPFASLDYSQSDENDFDNDGNGESDH